METCIAALHQAVNSDDVVKIVCNSVESTDLYTFSEMLAEDAVCALLQSPAHAKFHHLLQLFAYGTYEEYLLKKDELPELTPAMILKLRQLTLLTMGMQNKRIPVKQAMCVLQLESVLELQAIFIGAVYANILQGKWNTEKEEIEISSWRHRDVQNDELDAIRLCLEKWIQNCSSAIEGLENIAANAEQAIVDAEINEAKVEEEIKRLRKSMQEQEDESRSKEIRRSKISRTQKS